MTSSKGWKLEWQRQFGQQWTKKKTDEKKREKDYPVYAVRVPSK